MKILALDTASKSCSVALLDDREAVVEYTLTHGDTHSRYVMGMIHEVLRAVWWSMQDLEGVAVTIGPGSFTGLRIGLSTVKGLSMAAGLPVVGVSTLEALAYPFSTSEKLLCPMLDARRKEVYAALYRYNGSMMECVSRPKAVPPLGVLNRITEPCILTGDGAQAYHDLIIEALGPLAVFANQHIIRAASVGHIAMVRFKSGKTDSPGALEPLYLRSSDAEKNLKTPTSVNASC